MSFWSSLHMKMHLDDDNLAFIYMWNIPKNNVTLLKNKDFFWSLSKQHFCYFASGSCSINSQSTIYTKWESCVIYLTAISCSMTLLLVSRPRIPKDDDDDDEYLKIYLFLLNRLWRRTWSWWISSWSWGILYINKFLVIWLLFIQCTSVHQIKCLVTSCSDG